MRTGATGRTTRSTGPSPVQVEPNAAIRVGQVAEPSRKILANTQMSATCPTPSAKYAVGGRGGVFCVETLSMGIREQINEKPAIATAVTGSIIFLALIFMLYQLSFFGLFGSGYRPPDVYFQASDGSLYVDGLDIMQERDGGEYPVRAYKVRYGEGEPFVYFLERYNPDLEDQFAYDSFEVRHPADDTWYPRFSAEGQSISTYQVDSNGNYPVDVLP